eukprot:11812800-Alexandrium_andersonii.AAC.1
MDLEVDYALGLAKLSNGGPESGGEEPLELGHPEVEELDVGHLSPGRAQHARGSGRARRGAR